MKMTDNTEENLVNSGFYLATMAILMFVYGLFSGLMVPIYIAAGALLVVLVIAFVIDSRDYEDSGLDIMEDE